MFVISCFEMQKLYKKSKAMPEHFYTGRIYRNQHPVKELILIPSQYSIPQTDKPQ